MKNAELDNFKGILAELKHDLQELNKQSMSLSTRIESNCLVPVEMTEQLMDALENYQKKAIRLQQTGAKISITISDSIDQINADIEAAEKNAQLALERLLILDYFRLTAAAENVRLELENSKRILMDKCRLPTEKLADELEPYKLVVRKICEEDNELQDEEFVYIENHISRPIARALDKRHIEINPNQEVSEYLDGSCSLLKREDGREQELESQAQMSEEQQLIEKPAQDDNCPALPDENEPEEVSAAVIEEHAEAPVDVAEEAENQTGNSKEAKVLPLWEAFGGYVGDTKISFKDEPASSLGASKFTSMAMQKPDTPYSIFIVGHQKFLDKNDIASRDDKYMAPTDEIRNYLVNHGFFTDVVISRGDYTRTFQMLTSKAWACYTKSDVVKYFNSRKVSLLVPGRLRMKTSDITPKNALKLMAIHDYYSMRKPRKNYMVFPDSQEEPMFANELVDSECTITVCPAVFQAGSEVEDVAAIHKLAENLEPDGELHIIVFSKDDIAVLAGELAFNPKDEVRVKYCLFQQPEVLYDKNGSEIEDDSITEVADDAPEIAEVTCPTVDDDNLEETNTEAEPEKLDSLEQAPANTGIPADVAAVNDKPPKVADHSHVISKDIEDENLLHRLSNAAKTPSDDEFYHLILDILCGESCHNFTTSSHISQALLLAKAASGIETNKKCKALYKQLLLATNAPLEEKSYSSESLASAFPDNIESPEVLVVSAYLFAMLVPETPWDYGLLSQVDEFMSGYEDYFPSLAAIKPLFSKLCGVHDLIPVGFSEGVLSKLGSESENENFIRTLRAQSKNLLVASIPKTRMKALPQLYYNCFGKASDLYKCLEIITEDKKSERELVDMVLEEYGEKQDGVYTLDDAKVEDKLNENWYAVNGQGSSFPLDFSARQQAIRQFTSRLKVMKAWTEQLEDLPTSKYDLARLKKFRDEIVGLAKSARQTLQGQSIECKPVAEWMIGYIETYLSGSGESVDSMFDELAYTGIITLDDERMPILEETLNTVKYFEPWRRVLRHISAPIDSFEKAKNEILGGGEESDLFDNLRQLEVIGIITGEEIKTSAEQLSEAKKAADDRTTRFKESLELAYTYDRITETEKENLAAIEKQHEKDFYDRRDFGIWRQLLKALERRIEELANTRMAELEKSLQAQMAKLGSEGKTSPVLDEAKLLLERDHNFAVTEEYINRFINGEVGFFEDLQSVLHEQDSFADFISNEVYVPIYNECFRGKNGNFRNVATDYLQKHYPKDWTVRLKDNSENLVKNWPIRKDSTLPLQIQNLFAGVGMGIKRAEKVAGRKEEIFRLELTPTAKSLADYRHPISAFGTQTKSPMNVVVLHGNVPPKQLVDQITEMGMGGLTIVLLNFPVSLAVRRQIAEEFHKTTGQNPFILIDQVLFLYLALHQETERLPIMLKCTLPFTTYQPFVRDGGSTADEMFCGRSKELATIKDPNGACVVYGGRQLGKTALLERAESLCFKPENRAYAVYCNILNCNSEESMVVKIVEDVRKKTGIIFEKCATIKALSDSFEKLFRDKKMESMLLLLDETDKFLSSIADQDYAPLQPLIDLKRSTKNNFKFVLAGLHNVCRAKNATARNGVFGQLGTPLCVKPLSPTDALQLLSRPLKYLGFQIDRYPHLETILTNTNYYPGILQFFGYMLVETLAVQYSKYYRAVDDNPPFTLQDDQLGAVMNSVDLNRSIRDKFRWSLELDQRYFMIARCIAILYYLSDEFTNSWLGFTIEEIMDIANDYGIQCLEGETAGEYKNLLDEMEEMGILSKPDAEKNQYRLRRSSFIDIIGSNFDAVNEDIRRNNGEV